MVTHRQHHKGLLFPRSALLQVWDLSIRTVGVGSLLLTERFHNIHKSSIILDSSLSTASLLFLLLSSLNLGSLSSDLSSTSQGTVNLSSEKGNVKIYRQIFQQGNIHTILKHGTSTGQIQLIS